MKAAYRLPAAVLAATMMLAIPAVFPARDAKAESKDEKKALETLDQFDVAIKALADEVAPAVVQIFTTGYVPNQPAGGDNLLTKQRSSGSGVFLDSQGYIVTNAHVVAGARRVQVLLASRVTDGDGGRSIVKPRGKLVGAQILGIDQETDLAVLKIQGSDYPTLELGDSDEVRQGQLVFAYGSPLGLEGSVTMGVVSALARQLRPDDPMIYIQTDAPINPGNSGGPLLNSRGEVVGINTMILSQSGGSEGLGFAAPSNIVSNIFNQIRSTGRVRRGMIGVNAQSITPTMSEGLGLPRDWGVVLADVYPGSPADEAGLRVGDVVLTLNGKPMENGRQFDVNLYGKPIGEKVALEIQRGSEERTVQVQVAERPGDPQLFAELVRPEENLIPKLGILAIDLDRNIMRMLPALRIETGVVVAMTAAAGPSWQGQFFPGDVIHAVNNLPITNLDQLRAVVQPLQFGDAVVVQLERGSTLRYLAFEME